MKNTWYRLGGLMILVATVGCGSTFLGEPEPSEDLGELKSRVLELQRKAAMTDVELDRLRQQIVELEARVGSAGPGVGARATIQPADSSRAEVTSASRSVEERKVPREPASVTAGVEESDLEPVEVDVRPAVPGPEESAALQESAPSLSPTEVAPAVAAVRQPMSRQAQDLYDQGYTLFHQGRYVDAESVFQRFQQENPNTDLTDNAQYWIGESRFARGDIGGALAAFRETADRFPQGNKIPDALLKTADCLERLGDVDGARQGYAEVVRRFPGTAAADLADARSQRLP